MLRGFLQFVFTAGWGLALLLGACNPDGSERRGSTGVEKETNAGAAKEAEEDTTELGKQLAALIKDQRDFEPGDLDDKVPCTPLTEKGDDVDQALVPWPKSLRNFLVVYLKSMPIAADVLKAVHGIYLAEEGVLEDEVGGITCIQAADKAGIIVINYGPSVKKRQDGGLGTYQVGEGVVENFIFVNMRDVAASTVVHEAMHAIDFHLYMYGSDANSKARDELFDLSWAEYDEPKDAERISVYALDDRSTTHAKLAEAWQHLKCQGGGRSSMRDLSEMGLLGASAPQLAKEFKYLAEDTNFIVPYTMTNALEDFAETLTVYLFLTRHKVYDHRQIYDKDLTAVPKEEATLLYDHDLVQILESQSNQRDKMCKLAKAVFGEDCQL